MTLTQILEIQRALIQREEVDGLDFAERLWIARGRPVDRLELGRCLEDILVRCTECGLRYPPILLKRKRELQRDVWRPVIAPDCPTCGGRGVVQVGTHGAFCSCPAGEKLKFAHGPGANSGKER